MRFNMNKIFKKSIIAIALPIALAGCGSDDSTETAAIATRVAVTAPAMSVGIQSAYQTEARYAYQSDESEQIALATEKYQEVLAAYDTFTTNLYSAKTAIVAHSAKLRSSNSYPGYASLNEYNYYEQYPQAGAIVKYYDAESNRYGVFTNKWWTENHIPNFDDKSGPWQLIAQVDSNGNYLSAEESINSWKEGIAYVAGDVIKHVVNGVEYYFEAKYWTKDTPILTVSSGINGVTTADWASSWQYVGPTADDLPDEVGTTDPEDIITPPGCDSTVEYCGDRGDVTVITPTIPPIVPEPDPEETVAPDEITPPPSLELGDDGLPAEGYEFLRAITTEDWDWLFPMRSGRYNSQGGYRNMPPIALADGSTDTFSLQSFKNAVIEYNTWAASKGYKQFLNEGTKSQQALEFVTFWAKSSRETSGSWNNAPAPWIVNDPIAGPVWKGGLYWVEEVGNTTDSNGVSTSIDYVDYGSSYTPVPGRSYYGRGIIQLSWNYNYGAFSQWLYENGMMRDLITSRDTLLSRPDYVATNGTLSILSGIWFWMTPQGAKPASQDVMLGTMTHVSQFSQDTGLPQRNDGGNIPTAEGDSKDEAVIAYRLGTVINIVNGGIECNGAAKHHPGPVQRISYYNAYAKYFNAKIEGVDITTIKDATNVWKVSVTPSSSDNLKMASCFAQKAYYGW